MQSVLCIILFFFLSLSGCSLQSIARSEEHILDSRSCTSSSLPAKTIWITGNGWHTGIILQSDLVPSTLKFLLSEFSTQPYVEIGWGDREFYQSSGYSWIKGIKALFFSSGAVLHVSGLNHSEFLSLLKGTLITVQISDTAFQKLIGHIIDTVTLNASHEAVVLGNSLYGKGHYYAASGDFSIFHTCNSWTAAALQSADCAISQVIKASSLIAELQKLPSGK